MTETHEPYDAEMEAALLRVRAKVMEIIALEAVAGVQLTQNEKIPPELSLHRFLEYMDACDTVVEAAEGITKRASEQ
ncbi:hypothetical protein BH10PAT3_BH10PAT3_4980 [soil metagenome]